jgi:hypothetical protein
MQEITPPERDASTAPELDAAEVQRRLEQVAKEGPAKEGPAAQVGGRVANLEQMVTALTEQTGRTFQAFDNEVMDLFSLCALMSAGLRRVHDVLHLMLEHPENPHSTAQKALELLDAPLDLGGEQEDNASTGDEAEPDGDSVVPKSEGDQQPDA